MIKHLVCPTCGALQLIEAGELLGEDVELSAHDQTASDQDQTWSDSDQTSSDRDRRSAHEDQNAADAAFAASGDARTYESTKSAREHSQRDRGDIGRVRDETAAARLETAEHRDRSSELRDQLDEEKDRRGQEEAHGASRAAGEDLLLRVERDRAIAAADRARAADDRAKAAADREEATREREEAFLAQAEARHDLLLAATDELTGAFTRKFGLENISREIERARRTQDSMLLAFVDVDGLKEVNDKRGHSDGDRLLRRVVDKIRANIRAYDLIVRYGGDEFLCALPHLDLAVARSRMEKIADELSKEDAQHSIAFGLAEYDQVGGLDELIARADTELLEAKRSHKGRS